MRFFACRCYCFVIDRCVIFRCLVFFLVVCWEIIVGIDFFLIVNMSYSFFIYYKKMFLRFRNRKGKF